MTLRSFSHPTAVVLALGLAVAACGDDSETTSAQPPSEELLAACESFLTKVDGFGVTNGCTEPNAPASRCEFLHDDDRCESEFLAQYACLEEAATVEDCQCEMEGGYPLCNSAEGACLDEIDAVLGCLNQGG